MDKFRNNYRIPSARAQWWDYGRDAAYFITICTKDRKFYFGDVLRGLMELSESGMIANRYWLEIPEHFPFVRLGAFIVMPNHIHGILIIKQTANSDESTDAQSGRLSESSESSEFSETPKKPGGNNPQWHSGTIGVIINQYKRICTINARKANSDFGWQSRFHDHIIRNNMEFERIANYINNNPANWMKDKFKDPDK